MPVAKLLGANTPDAMNSEEGNDSLDTFLRQAVGKQPLFSFSRTEDSPTQWIQLLHSFDQPDLTTWPLLAPMKPQMQKCDKCA
nr:zinc finger, C2H2 [Tanacetum cinerariifolium]